MIFAGILIATTMWLYIFVGQIVWRIGTNKLTEYKKINEDGILFASLFWPVAGIIFLIVFIFWSMPRFIIAKIEKWFSPRNNLNKYPYR